MACIQEYADISVWTVESGADGNPIVNIPADDLLV